MKTVLIYLSAAVMAGGLVYGGMLLRDHHEPAVADTPRPKAVSGQPEVTAGGNTAGRSVSPAPHRKWRPKAVPLPEKNRRLFYEYALPWITQAECGSIPAPCCHVNPHDPGGFTCIGVSLKSSGQVLSKIINDSWQTCKRHNPVNKALFLCKSLPAKKLIEDYYYQQYFRPFDACPFWTAFQLMDSQILSGQAARLFQRSVGLKSDNVFGSISKAACPLFDAAAFRAERIKRFKTLKTWGHFGQGWTKRLDKLALYVTKHYRRH